MSEGIQPMLAAIAEPTRFRIVELLSTRACTVGEVAEGIGALQPQTTKHIQALEAAGVIRVHKLGRRRVARLDRASMSMLSSFFGRLAVPDPDDAVLESYEASIGREEARRPGDDGARVLTFERELPFPAAVVWDAWTDAEQAAQWWAPRHFHVDVFDIAPQEGTPIRFVLHEGDGATYESVGRVVEVRPRRQLVFTLAPVDATGVPLFSARHTVSLTEEDGMTTVRLRIVVSEVRAEAAPMTAGLEPGWNQLLDGLRRSLAAR
ncbi:SRPBCC domain-containing protein [Nonomuraea sp. NPDC050478]|uniref:SRPBCC domain-containing protein n=1 Tax=unclassified Nonomuraea TaxID=2593643 RepID=UPI0011CD7C29|nr:SRPBCC domain-containing protein [Nonomuraea sp. C10]TXK35955.1 helix-turn-helix domain-containing protein [Nonomuraea sp. C10]